MNKYKVPVEIHSYASKNIGFIECNTIDEFKEKAEELWESQNYDYPSINISNDFDLSDWDMSEITEDDLRFYKLKT